MLGNVRMCRRKAVKDKVILGEIRMSRRKGVKGNMMLRNLWMRRGKGVMLRKARLTMLPLSRRCLDAEGPFKDVRQRVYPGLFNDTDRWVGDHMHLILGIWVTFLNVLPDFLHCSKFNVRLYAEEIQFKNRFEIWVGATFKFLFARI